MGGGRSGDWGCSTSIGHESIRQARGKCKSPWVVPVAAFVGAAFVGAAVGSGSVTQPQKKVLC
jgi:hypothetical protein